MTNTGMDKEKVKAFIEKHKWILAGIGVGVLCVGMLLLNINYIQISYHKMNKETTAIANILSKELKQPRQQERNYFQTGMDYLVESLDAQGNPFFETNFSAFLPDYQEKILLAYNKKELLFDQPLPIIKRIAEGNISNVYKVYMSRVEPNIFELGLLSYFGDEVHLDEERISQLLAVSTAYPGGLPLERFRIDLYALMSNHPVSNSESNAAKLLASLNGEKVKEQLFEQMKTVAVDVDLLSEWVELLRKYEVIDNTDYVGFTNSYSSITQIRDNYKQFDAREVDLRNKKEAVDVATQGMEEKLVEVQQEATKIEKSIGEKQNQLNGLNQYESIELYIMDYYGDGEYEASIPEKSWFFGTYKPSDNKVRVRLTTTNPNAQGVFGLKVYREGSVGGVPYYVEATEAQMQNIAMVKSEINALQEDLNENTSKQKEITDEISNIRMAENYEGVLKSIEDLNSSRQTVQRSLKEQQLKIQNLFGIGNLIVEIDK